MQGYFPGSGRLPDLTAFTPTSAAAARAMRSPPVPPPAIVIHAGQAGSQAMHAPVAAPARRNALQAKAGSGDVSVELDPGRIGLIRGGGSPLPAPLRARMEAALGADFSSVRVHIGPQAGRLGALAFTMGNDLYFAAGQFQPDTQRGQQLIGHELAHVVQQRQGRVRADGNGVTLVHNQALEAEADRLGARAAAWIVPVRRAGAPAGGPTAPVTARIAQAMKRGRPTDNGFSDRKDFNSDASDSETEPEDEDRKIQVTAKTEKAHHAVVFNHTKRQGYNIVKGKRVTKRDDGGKRLVKRVNNYVYQDKRPNLTQDATTIHHVIPAKAPDGKANRSFGATTIITAIFLDGDGKYRKYCFTNLDRTVSTDLQEMANSLGYHMVVAPKGHAEGEMIQYSHTYKDRRLVAIGCDKPHCHECNYLMARYYNGGPITDQTTSDEVFSKYHVSPILELATGSKDRPSLQNKWKKKSGHRTDRGQYDPSDEQRNAIVGRNLVRIAPNGDCLYAAVVAAGHATSVRQLRDDLATAIENGTIDISGWGDPVKVGRKIRKMGSYAHYVGDYAPELLTQLLHIRIEIIPENGVAYTRGAGGPTVSLLRVTYPLEHYHLVQ
jgi:hypothetical protein